MSLRTKKYSQFTVLAGVVMAIAVVTDVTGCVKKPPVQDVLIYSPDKIMVEGPDRVQRIQFSGTRSYLPEGSKNWKDHTFTFENPTDVLTLTINDNNGVPPGQKFSYFLSLVRNGLVVKSWPIETAVPSGPGEQKSIFIFKFALKAPDGGEQAGGAFPPDTEVGGTYELSATNRPISAQILWNLTKSVRFTDAKPAQWVVLPKRISCVLGELIVLHPHSKLLQVFQLGLEMLP
jgi:hypothetical protein